MLVWWCETHKSLQGNAGICQASINIAYRVGGNPFNNHGKNACRFVEMRLTPKDALVIERERFLDELALVLSPYLDEKLDNVWEELVDVALDRAQL